MLPKKESANKIIIRGARTHNLQNINLEIPRDKLVVITGVSGSGKSSLAFDTLYAEGQRRYVESLSVYARQFLSVMEKPDVDTIEGLSPAIAIQQKASSHNPRSTVGTITEIYDYLRLLFARIGQPKCPKHNLILQAQTISQMVEQIMLLPEATPIMLLAPLILDRKGEHEKKLQELVKLGFMRIRIDGKVIELTTINSLNLNPKQKHTIEVVIDRLKVNLQHKQRIADSLESALKVSPAMVMINNLDTNEDTVFSAQFSCPHCGWSLTELEPRLFSFNSPHGACSICSGLGNEQFMDPEKIITDPSLSLSAGAIRGWDRNHQYYYGILTGLAKYYDFSLSMPFKKLSQKIKNIIFYGSGDEEINFTLQYENFAPQKKHQPFQGIIAHFNKRYRETTSDALRDELAKLLSHQPCTSCLGSRLNEQARQVFIEHHNLSTVTNLSIKDAALFFQNLKLTGMRSVIGSKILKEVQTRLKFLIDVGLEYLTLARSADTLSGGEAQRIRLASQIGSGLVGVMYVLDEPSIGLHQRDNAKLISTLIRLRDLGNSVIVVEHDHDTIMQADFVIDVGLGAGQHGGKIIALGTPNCIIKNKESLTGQYLAKIKHIATPKKRLPVGARQIVIHHAKTNNLKDLTVSIPIGLVTCITGVSGSGKSTLINDTLWPVAAHKLNGANISSKDALTKISGLEHLNKVIDITQDPIGRTPRSNPATYIGLFTEIRDLFAKTSTARAKGYNAGRFSFNVKDGRCTACGGDGLIKVEMHFLADVYVTCDVCHGKRYNDATLEIHYKDKNINDILHMTVEEAREFFASHPIIKRKLDTLADVGLDYITLGQSATTLSGGEAQRIKLAKELSRKDTGDTLYILDEPTTGLHFHDINRLLSVLKTLRDRGNTIIIIEHNLDVVKVADWIIDLGPEGGDKGGTIVATGTPEEVAKNKKSYTGKFLQEVL